MSKYNASAKLALDLHIGLGGSKMPYLYYIYLPCSSGSSMLNIKVIRSLYKKLFTRVNFYIGPIN
jgi:hypothetical protein